MTETFEPHVHDLGCAIAHGEVVPPVPDRKLVAVFAAPVALALSHFAQHLGWSVVILDPVPTTAETHSGVTIVDSVAAAGIDAETDVVVTDHDRPELGDLLAAVLAEPTRWVGVMGSPRHSAPHVAALRERGLPEDVIARVHRPIGLNIGSRTPAEIAVSTLAGLLADRTGRSGGFYDPTGTGAGSA